MSDSRALVAACVGGSVLFLFDVLLGFVHFAYANKTAKRAGDYRARRANHFNAPTSPRIEL
jgi:hypothetical protein